ncbi:bifunctional UDP-sugar hydrolase/5'-nucleotidase [uncultured Alistipes sp.]|uniref:bifunctional metallophosphatase/5'-nucleotidase n=1 Tax=uncultured Alistipes sp. TaxID=538949 RepID=UPI00261E696C|nr:bifunctional UDP-sugar hydrolase/5'-nucleotidase [uncultured Alistipes sp.]
MKRLFRLLAMISLTAAAVACAPRERTLVLLSTNDMHAKIQRFPHLAAAVAACRDTVTTLLLDAGDRWTGNAYVDLAQTPGMPVIALMNRLGYDAATLGNHEFDHGQAFLGRMLDSMAFEVVCANVESDTCTFPQLPPSVVIERDGIRIGIVGAVTNYEGPGHPAGNASCFEGLSFPDPQAKASECAAALRPDVDVLVLLSHMGDDRDAELLARETRFDVILGGHTHEEVDTLVNGTLLTQTGKDLQCVGVTTIRLRGRKIAGIDYRLVPLGGYAPDPEYQAEVDRCYADERLNRPVGSFASAADKAGLANWMASAAAAEAGAEVGFYHIGGVRLDSIPAGGIGTARIYDLEPFGTQIAVMRMTPRQMERMIVAKYNEPTREGHRLDLVSTTPYEILVNEADSAVGVRFPQLRGGRSYRVSVSDYVYKNYQGLEYADGSISGVKVADVLLRQLGEESPLKPDNRMRQRIVRSPAAAH